MDRLIKADVQSLDLLFTPGQKCSGTFTLTNLMHTMPVAVSLTSSHPSLLSFPKPFTIISPLSVASLTVHLARPLHLPPISAALPPALSVRSSMLPTGKAHPDDLTRLFSKPGPHIFKDATIPISFVGPHVAEFLLSPAAPPEVDVDSLFAKAIAWCDRSQLTDLLRLAAGIGNPNYLGSLIDAGADVNSRGAAGKSLVYAAVESGDAESVRILIGSGCEIDDRADRLLLHVAAEMGRVDLMEVICLGFADADLNAVNSHGQTPLHVASIHGGVETVRFLTSVGADPDATDDEGWTALHHAAHGGRLEAVECLLTRSVFGKHAVTKEGKSAFELAVEGGHSSLYDCLHLGDLLQRAARKDEVETMKRCMERGAKVNGRDQNGWTALHRSAFKGHMESVRILVSHGARIDVSDCTGYTPLLRAVEGGHVEIAMYLLANGAKNGIKT